MQTQRPPSDSEPFAVRLALVLLAESLFALLVVAVTGGPPEFVTTVVFAFGLALLVDAQAARSEGVPPRL